MADTPDTSGSDELIGAYLDNEATAEQHEALKAWLRASPENVRVFVRQTHAHQVMRDEFRAGRIQGELNPSSAPVPAPASEQVRKRFRFGFWRWVAAASVLLCYFGYRYASSNQAPDFGVNLGQLAAAATVEKIVGKVSIVNEYNDFKTPIHEGILLTVRDGLECEGDAQAVVKFRDGTTIVLISEKTGARMWMRYMAEKKDILTQTHGKRVTLEYGVLTADVAKQSADTPMILATPRAEAKVIGTRFRLEAAPQFTRLDVHEGRIQFMRLSDRQTVLVGATEYAIAADRQDSSGKQDGHFKPFESTRPAKRP